MFRVFFPQESGYAGAQGGEVEWGPMLVTYFNLTQPGGPVISEPPPLVSPQSPGAESVYLPIVVKAE